MNGQIFISYRREDASYPAGRLYDNLHIRFPQNEIFMDVDSLKPGIDFVETIEERVGSCDVLVAVIGKRWLSAADEEGRRRLDNPEDFVRVEVGTALKRGVRVIPVLVEGALMPQAGQLPEELKTLARRNALSVSHDRFRADSERLIDSVGEVLEAARVERPPRPPEGQLRRGPVAGQGKTEAPQGMGAGPGAPASDRTPLKGVTAKLKRPRRLLVVIGIGVVVCLLGVGLFKATRPQPVSIGGSSSPTPAPLAAALNSPSPTPLVSQVSPSPSPSGAKGLTEAKHYIDLGDYANALPLFQKAADGGNTSAMNSLGDLYYDGKGVAQDSGKAREWYKKAADAGNAVAMTNLGWLYGNGKGVAQDSGKAREWYKKAADAGNTDAMYNLGVLYANGKGVAQDYDKAREWYKKAADAGNTDAKQALASQSSPPQPAPVAVAIPSPSISATPTKEELARRAFDNATKDHPWVNSLGMEFVPVAGTEVLFSVWDTRVQDFETFVKSTDYDATGGMYSLGKEGWQQHGATWKEPGFSQGANHPVVGVSWNDAKEFCKWLTKRERIAGDLPQDREYRLAKDEEWSAAVGLKNEAGSTPEEKGKSGKIQLYPWDIPQKRDKSWPPPSGAGNYCGEESRIGNEPKDWSVIKGYNDGYPRTSPVGSFSANQFGLYDMGGNVWQWCEDWYNAQAQYRVLRGASWDNGYPGLLLASYRGNVSTPDIRYDCIGFRCVVAVESSR